MKRSTCKFRLSALAVGLAAVAIPAHAQFMGVFQGISNAIGQVAGKATSRAFQGQGEDLQAAYDKFFGQVEAQTAGMDKASKRRHVALVEQQWPTLENAILLKNAQLQREKDAPLLDVREVAGAAVGGLAMQVSMNTAIAGAGGGVLDGIRSGAMSGILDGAQAGTQKAVSALGGAAAQPSAGDLDFTPGPPTHPLQFLGTHPTQLSARDLYRDNGFMGWKRIERSAGAEAYAPITGEGQVRYAVYNFDPGTGAIKAAFRVLAASPVAFTNAVAAYSQMLGAEPRYASAGSVLRAVWESGAFVTADPGKLSAGWSSLVPATYAAAASTK